MQNDDMAAMTNEGNFRGGFSVDEISLNGDRGRFILRPKDSKKDEETNAWPKEDLGVGVSLTFDPDTGKKIITDTSSLELVLLKIRRKISYYSPALFMNSNEHNHKGDYIKLYGANPKDEGIAADVWERQRAAGYTLKTTQVVYCYSPMLKKVVRLIVKGSSLGSKESDKNVLKFYDYLKTFTGDDHFYNFITEIVPVPEIGPKGDMYFAMSFKRKEKLDPEQQQRINDLIRATHESIVQVDKAFDARIKRAPTDGVSEDTIDYDAPEEEYSGDDDEINPADIPF
jgi:hypothetical protein